MIEFYTKLTGDKGEPLKLGGLLAVDDKAEVIELEHDGDGYHIRPRGDLMWIQSEL